MDKSCPARFDPASNDTLPASRVLPVDPCTPTMTVDPLPQFIALEPCTPRNSIKHSIEVATPTKVPSTVFGDSSIDPHQLSFIERRQVVSSGDSSLPKPISHVPSIDKSSNEDNSNNRCDAEVVVSDSENRVTEKDSSAGDTIDGKSDHFSNAGFHKVSSAFYDGKDSSLECSDYGNVLTRSEAGNGIYRLDFVSLCGDRQSNI